MSKGLPVFRSWVPNWLITLSIFLVMLPSMSLFSFFVANPPAAAGYYGLEPTDIQYSTLIFYGALAAFYPLEQRFFSYIASRQYLALGVFLLITASWISYQTRSAHVFFAMRFLQGIFNGGVNSICLTLIFSRLSGERSREIGYSVFYGLLIGTAPIISLAASLLLDNFEYNILYKTMIFMLLPGPILLLSIMNDVRLKKKIPLYQLDWVSFFYWQLSLLLIGYILVYGQQYYWLEDFRIRLCLALLVVFSFFFIIRQKLSKRPLLDLKIYRYKNFLIGSLLIVVLYICRGSLNITSGYFATALGMDPIHVSELLLANVIGIALSVIVASRLVLQKKPMRLIWLAGFGLLFLFHAWMYFLFASQADSSSYILPLIIQGLGTGTLMTPIILFTVSSVPEKIRGSASVSGIFSRFLGFSLSMCLINYFQLYRKSIHVDSFRNQITDVNPKAVERLAQYKKLLLSKGLNAEDAGRMASSLLNKSMDAQSQLRYAMDYYWMISLLILAVILLIAISPYLNKTVINLRSRQPEPAPF